MKGTIPAQTHSIVQHAAKRKHMGKINDTELDARIEQKLRRLGMIIRDGWHDVDSAAAHLKVSRSHFLRLANSKDAPTCSGTGRMRRWRTSALDAYQNGRENRHG
jgi:predicted DNA-binding transcriptional regulator AlpA